MTEQALQQQARVDLGLCRTCAQDVVPGRTRCAPCLAAMREASKARYRAKTGTTRSVRCSQCWQTGHNAVSCTGPVPRCEAIILRGILRRCGEPAEWRIETEGHADSSVCDACRETTVSALKRAGYEVRIVPATDGERRARP